MSNFTSQIQELVARFKQLDPDSFENALNNFQNDVGDKFKQVAVDAILQGVENHDAILSVLSTDAEDSVVDYEMLKIYNNIDVTTADQIKALPVYAQLREIQLQEERFSRAVRSNDKDQLSQAMEGWFACLKKHYTSLSETEWLQLLEQDLMDNVEETEEAGAELDENMDELTHHEPHHEPSAPPQYTRRDFLRSFLGKLK